jgi:translation elongation factor EF-Tu-like GTPase
MDQPADIEAEIHFLTTAEGGRKTPCRSGYRACYDFGLKGTLNDVFTEFIEKEWVAPGESVTTRLWFFVPQFQLGRLHEGFEFTVHEGHAVHAKGRITKIFNDAMRGPP